VSTAINNDMNAVGQTLCAYFRTESWNEIKRKHDKNSMSAFMTARFI
jgi:hypothetical protein